MSNPAPALVVSEGQRAALEVLWKSQTASHREVQRAQVLLMAAEGLANESIAKITGTSPGTVRAWRARFEEEGLAKLGKVRAARGLKPHRVEAFKLSTDPRLEEKLIDVVGLYLNPPEQAIMLCMDEKSGRRPRNPSSKKSPAAASHSKPSSKTETHH